MGFGDYNPFFNALAGPSNIPPDRLQMSGYGMSNAAADAAYLQRQAIVAYEYAKHRKERLRLMAIESIKRQPFFNGCTC